MRGYGRLARVHQYSRLEAAKPNIDENNMHGRLPVHIVSQGLAAVKLRLAALASKSSEYQGKGNEILNRFGRH
jgi:hypothetical protein